MLWIGTSWKMNGTAKSARAFCAALVSADLASWQGVQAFVIPPATLIRETRAVLGASSGVLVGAQNAHWADSGAWTGEISVAQMADAGADLVEIGHSERREHFGETDRTVNLKVKSVLAHGLRPLVCVGEPREVFDAGRSTSHVCEQVDAALDGVRDTSQVLLAYEPIWAIGENGRQPAHGEIDATCEVLAARFGSSTQALLYGGSVSPQTATRLLELPGVSGLFVGRAAWHAAGFLEILRLARQVAAAASSEEGASVTARQPVAGAVLVPGDGHQTDGGRQGTPVAAGAPGRQVGGSQE